jgi:hypothetical protein
LRECLVVVVSSDKEAEEVCLLCPLVKGAAVVQKLIVLSIRLSTQVKKIVAACREYILGMTMEIERRRLQAEEPENVQRMLELAAYFAHCDLQPVHLQLALRSAVRPSCSSVPYSFGQHLLTFIASHPICPSDVALVQSSKLLDRSRLRPPDPRP